MLLSILLCALLLAFSTCSPVNLKAVTTKEQSQSMSDEQNALEDLRAAFIEASESVESPTLVLSRLVTKGQALEKFWNICLDKMSAYSHNQVFFKNTLPAFINEFTAYHSSPLPTFTADTLFMSMKIFCEQRSCATYSKDLASIAGFFKDGCNPFEGLSDEFLTLAANYIRSTLNIRKLFVLLQDQRPFLNRQDIDDSLFEKQLLSVIVTLKSLVAGLQKVDLMGVYRPLSNAIKATRRTMVPANKPLISFLTELLAWKISSLAKKVSKTISPSCNSPKLATPVNKIIADIEAITIPLYRASFDLNRGVAERLGRGEVLWNSFLKSLLVFESISVKPSIDAIRQVSEKFSDFFDHFLGAFLKGEDEPWTFGLKRRLGKTKTLWRRVLETSVSDLKDAIPSTKHRNWFSADLSLMFQITCVVDKLEDPLALDRPTRKKFVEFWREAQALLRLLELLSQLIKMAKHFARMEKLFSAAFMKESLSGVLNEQIAVVQGQGINFQLGKYHQFIDELPEHQEAIAQRLRTFSDGLSRSLEIEAIDGTVEAIFLPLKSPIYAPLKHSLKQLLTRPPQLFQPQERSSRSAESTKKQSKRLGSKPKGTSKNRKVTVPQAVVPQARASDKQIFVRISPQYVDGLELLEETPENPWTLVKASQDCQTFRSLANQPAREILKKFARKPLGWDGILPTNPRDMRNDKTKVTIATFNVEWLFLFNLSTEKLEGKIKWKSLKEAWDHIRDVADAIRKIDADIICLCEVQDMRILSILVELLPELNYQAYLIPNHDSLGQNVGILTRVDTLASISRIRDELFPKNIVLHLKLDNGRGDLVDLVLAGVHLISSAAEADHAGRAYHRKNQAQALKQFLTVNYDTSGETIHIVLGDFNMVDPGLLSTQTSDCSEEALDVVKYEEFVLSNAMTSSHAHADSDAVSSGVCHIFTSHPLLVTGSRIIDLDGDNAPYKLRVSDHSPVVTTVHLPPLITP